MKILFKYGSYFAKHNGIKNDLQTSAPIQVDVELFLKLEGFIEETPGPYFDFDEVRDAIYYEKVDTNG